MEGGREKGRESGKGGRKEGREGRKIVGRECMPFFVERIGSPVVVAISHTSE